ncbi:MAG TPA: Gfo/Idh/MocA family oxidoreductase [Gemmataceae bacterium]|nr:Gfo/Idh/MocA family oxidoreductase [Gemmataceae bacterium]
MSQASSSTPVDRRDFMKAAGVAAAGIATASIVNNAYAGGSDTIKVGLIGCGGRGTGAAHDCTSSAPGVKLWALGDVFKRQVDGAKKNLGKALGDKFEVADDRCFDGLDAYQKVLESGVDLVILATPPGFRPLHLEAAVQAGKNIFTEKPVGVDGPGIRKVLDLVDKAKEKKLAVGAGTQRRHQTSYRQTMKLIHDGAIGDIVAARAYWNGGGIWFRKREDWMSDAEYQINNWYHFVWTCGDHIVEQHVHNLDVINWAMNDHPISAMGMGGRSNRDENIVKQFPESQREELLRERDPAKLGQIFDHFAVEYKYKNGVVMQSYCRHIANCADSVSEALVGTKGTCFTRDGGPYEINGKSVFEGPDNKPYVQEHTDLIESIRKGEPLNELKNVAESTLTAILGRMTTYSGQTVTWDEALKSQDKTFPDKLSLKISLPVSPVPVVGAGPRKARKGK